MASFQDMSQKLYTCNNKKRSSDSDGIECNEDDTLETDQDVEYVPEVYACEIRWCVMQKAEWNNFFSFILFWT